MGEVVDVPSLEVFYESKKGEEDRKSWNCYPALCWGAFANTGLDPQCTPNILESFGQGKGEMSLLWPCPCPPSVHHGRTTQNCPWMMPTTPRYFLKLQESPGKICVEWFLQSAKAEGWAETLGATSGRFGNPREGSRDERIVPRPCDSHRVLHLDTWAWRRNLGFTPNSASRPFLSYFYFLFLSTFCLAKPWFNHPKLHLCNTAVSLWPKRAQSRAQPTQCSPNLPNLTVPDKSELRFSSSSCLCEFWNESGSSGAVPGGWEKQMLLQYLREWEVMTLVITGLSDWYWAWNGCWRIWLIKD